MRSSVDKPTKRRTRASISSRISLNCGMASIAGVQILHRRERLLPHGGPVVVLQPQNDVEQGAAFQAESPGTSPQSAKVDEPELPLCRARHLGTARLVIRRGACEVGLRPEFVLFDVVDTFEFDPQSGHHVVAVNVFGHSGLVQQFVCRRAPVFPVRAEPRQQGICEVGQHDLQLNWNRDTVPIQIAAFEEVVFVYRRTPRQTIGVRAGGPMPHIWWTSRHCSRR